jgi:hypothetical protein
LILWYTQRNARIGQILPYIESTCLKLVELNLKTYVSCWELSYIYWSEKRYNLVSLVTGYSTVYFLELNVVHLSILQCVILKFLSTGGFTFTEHLYPCLLMAQWLVLMPWRWPAFPVLFSCMESLHAVGDISTWFCTFWFAGPLCQALHPRPHVGLLLAACVRSTRCEM